MNVYAEDGVDFSKEREIVSIFKKLYQATKGFTEDLREYGFLPPDDIGYFSDGVRINTEKLYKKTGGGDIAMIFGMDGAGTKPRAHLAHLQTSRSRTDADAMNEVAEIAGQSRACTGICTVAMVANDIICGGARPAYLLDYVAWHDPDIEIAKDICNGLYIGAEQAGMTIVGGENASLSEMVNGYDICAAGCGFILNPRFLENPLDGSMIEIDDVIIGVASSGLHCNGISSGRKKLIYSPPMNWMGMFRIDEVVPELGKTAAEEILTPTIIYKEPVFDGVLSDPQFDVKAIVNTTGEGIHNLKRALSGKKAPIGAYIDVSRAEKIRAQPVFGLIQKKGEIPDREMWEDFNMGIGMQMIVPRDQSQAIIERLEEYQVGNSPILASEIGEIIEDDKGSIRLKTDKFHDVY